MKNQKQKFSLIFLVVLLVLALVMGIFNKTGPSITTANESNAAENSDTTTPEKVLVPEFIIKDVDGNDVEFSSFHGKPTVINFWTSWCVFCQDEMPDFEKLKEDYGDEVNFIFLDVVGANGETQEKALAFLEDNGFDGITPHFDTYSEASSLFGINSFPTTAFIDAEGYLVSGIVGKTDYDTVVLYLEDMEAI